MCSNVPRSYLNENACKLSYEPTLCTPLDTPDATLPLETWALWEIFQATGGTYSQDTDGPNTRYVYAITGLRNDPAHVSSPCTPGARSRWILTNNMTVCDDPSLLGYPSDTVDQQTKDIFAQMLSMSPDKNGFMRDVTISIGGKPGCNEGKYSFTVAENGRCWRNVDPGEFQVYDFTDWVKLHPGGPAMIKQWAHKQWDTAGFFQLQFPGWHPL
jgi:hypothetical protein